RGCIARVEGTLLALKTAICQEVASCDLLPLVYDSECIFDPSEMSDIYASERYGKFDITEKPIIGAVGLGVERVMTVRQVDGTTITKREVVLRPQVVLTDSFQ
ncbi:hypothetical protein FA15DRAFT_561734, partial [Coprinopsis marcescibilis]